MDTFAMVAIAVLVLVLRRTDPARTRPFRTPAVAIVAPLAVLGCLYLFFSLSGYTLALFAGWAVIGLFVYFLYSRAHSHVGRGVIDVNEDDTSAAGPADARRAYAGPEPSATRDSLRSTKTRSS